MKRLVMTLLSGAAALGLNPGPAQATDISFILNWVAGGDHAPYYWAQQERSL